MKEVLITQSDLGKLLSCSERTIRRKIFCGEIEAYKSFNAKNIDKYLIPVSTLPDAIKAKYYRLYKDRLEETSPLSSQPVRKHNRYIPPYKTLDEMSIEERQEAEFWIRTVEAWHLFRLEFAGTKLEADIAFVAQMKAAPYCVSRDGLFKRDAELRKKNYNPYALIDHRGAHNKGETSIPLVALDWYRAQWMDQRRLSHASCYDGVRKWCQKYHPELVESLPSIHAFKRYIKNNIPEAEITYGRYGEKIYLDRHQPYITRNYDDLEANDVWIADNHTFDIISQRDDGSETTHRLYLTAFMDARSSVITGWYITDNSSSQSTIYALRHGILRYGIPRYIYVDNGSEFLTHDVGGRGHRRRKKQEGQLEPPPIFARLGITMINAIVKNAKAKTIERTFSTFKMQISQLFETFTGGSVDTRPEALKYVLKDGRIPLDSELRTTIADLIDGLYNMGLYGGAVKRDRGQRRIDVYNGTLHIRRTATADDLTLMLMRTSRPQKVGRNGVYLNIDGEKLYYWQSDVCNYQGKQVYVRYDPENLNEVRIYEGETDRYIACWPLAQETRLKFLAPPEAIRLAQQKVREPLKLTRAKVKAYKKSEGEAESVDILNVKIWAAREAREGMIIGTAPVIEPVFANETPAYALPQAVGEVKPVEVSLSRMNQNRMKRYQENRRYGGL